MKALLLAIGIVAAAGAWSSHAQAQNYPWCAYYGGDFGGAENCGFSTFEQCTATLSGIGGFCGRNTQYVPAAPSLQHKPRHLPRHS